MSSFEDKKLSAYADTYNKIVKELRAENAEKEKLKQAWEADKGLKPKLETAMGGPMKSEQEISEIATEKARLTVRGMEQRDKLERQNEGKKSRPTMDEIVKANRSPQEVAKAREDARKREERDRQIGRDRHLKP